MSGTPSTRAITALLLVFSLAAASPTQHGGARPVYLPFSAAKPIFDVYSAQLPPDVAQAAREPAKWMALAAHRDAEVRGRLARVRREYKEYAQRIQQARQSPGPGVEFAARSHLFEKRGLSLDTSLPPDFALEQALQQLKARHCLAPESVRRVAVIGPGLDFVDKDEGYDFYPVQSIQPFAVIDSLRRTGLAADALALDTLDLSRHIN